MDALNYREQFSPQITCSSGSLRLETESAKRRTSFLGKGIDLGDGEGCTASESEKNGETVVDGNKFLVIADLQGADEDDLTVISGELLSIIATRPDGWWLAENEKGERGLVPKTFLKLVPSSEKQNEQKPQQKLITDANQAPESISHDNEAEGDLNDSLEAYCEDNQQSGLKSHQKHDSAFRTRKNYESSTHVTYSSQLVLPTPKLTLNDSTQPSHNTIEQMQAEWPKNGLGAALESDIHLTCECHFAPRLSESNLAFHDIYWNFDSNKLRKRRVRVSKIIKLNKLENVPTGIANVRMRLIRACLFDFSGKTGKQIVSNVHTVKADDKNERNWSFSNKACGGQTSLEFSDFFVRSNYVNEDVVLMMEASVLCLDNDGLLTEEPVGYVAVPIVDNHGQCILENRTYNVTLAAENLQNRTFQTNSSTVGKMKLHFKVADFPRNVFSAVDSLPDVLLWNPLYIKLAFYYRRLLGESLIKLKSHAMNNELIADPFLSTFPLVADQPDLINLVHSLWTIKAKSFCSKITEEEEALEFKMHYMRTAFIIYKTLTIPKYNLKNAADLSKRQVALKFLMEQYCLNQNPVKFLSMHKCKPIDIFDSVVDLVGPHAID